MAASSSDESCVAPNDFRINVSMEECDCRSRVKTEICLLCNLPEKNFYCQQCVGNGDFFHSNPLDPERFAEKKLRLFKEKKERLKVLSQCEESFKKRRQADQLKVDMERCKERIQLLKSLTKEKRTNTGKEKKKYADVKKYIARYKMSLPKYRERIQELASFIERCDKKTRQQKIDLEASRLRLKALVRHRIHELVKYIFPISEVQPSRSDEDLDLEDTVSALADATRTAYVKGRWVYTDNLGELQYMIVEPTLPGSGDYSAYNVWVAANKDGVPGAVGEMRERNPAYTISAALTYTTQLVNVMAYYLDVQLPKKLCYSEFCSHEISDKKFLRKVAKLNANVLHLCFSQNVDPKLLNPSHTLHNLLVLLGEKSGDLGRQGPSDLNQGLMKSMEESLQSDLEACELTDDISGSEEENDFMGDWEPVPNLPCSSAFSGPTRHSMSTTTNIYSEPRLPSQTNTTASIAGGFMSSAAATVVSFVRGWTNQR